jgi:hypothetical protein
MLDSGTGILYRVFLFACYMVLFVDSSFRASGPDFGGKGSNGGVWEWTSTVFDAHDGFVGTGIFPGYSSDFFDGKHQTVVCPV